MEEKLIFPILEALKVNLKPEKGKAILFYNKLPNGQFDKWTFHGCTVVKGVKWAANKWIWTNVQGPY